MTQGNRSNLLFDDDLIAVELNSPDLVSSIFLDDGQHLQILGCNISQYYNRLEATELIPLLRVKKSKPPHLGCKAAPDLSRRVSRAFQWAPPSR